MKRRATLFAGLLAVILVSACASNPDRIDAAYVSPLKYQNYDCDQIALEMDYIGQRTTKIYQRLKKERNADNWQMGVGLILFWPTLFALEGGDGPEAAEYAQLKGEYEALRQVSVEKKCGIKSQSPEEIMKASQKDEKEEAVEVVEEYEAKHVKDVREIAEKLDCRELVSLKEVTADKEVWALGCSDGRTIEVQCWDGSCWTREMSGQSSASSAAETSTRVTEAAYARNPAPSSQASKAGAEGVSSTVPESQPTNVSPAASLTETGITRSSTMPAGTWKGKTSQGSEMVAKIELIDGNLVMTALKYDIRLTGETYSVLEKMYAPKEVSVKQTGGKFEHSDSDFSISAEIQDGALAGELSATNVHPQGIGVATATVTFVLDPLVPN